MKIAFLSNKLTLRGTEVSLFDYADYNETLLNNTSVIITREYNDVSDNKDAHIEAYNKFNNRFPVYYYKTIQSIETIIQENNIDIIFIEKAGSPTDGLVFHSCKTIIHSVFTLEEPHGDAYTSLSEWLNIHHNTNYDNIHYMVRVFDCEENLRDELNIPKDAIVYGTYSGADCFNIDYIKKCVRDLSKEDNNIYYIFLNIYPFCEETKYVRFLKGTSDMKRKRMFINTCDAMLYGRDGGETFGLSCGEFSICNKPIIARSKEHSASHLFILGDKIIKHSNYDELYSILTNWNKYKIDVKENGYKYFTPEYCMNEFNNVVKKLFPYNETLTVNFNGFWSGFLEKTNAIHCGFFIDLLQNIFNKNIKIQQHNNADILFETIFEKSIIKNGLWKYKFLFSGESRLPNDIQQYDIVLCGKKNTKNIINVPLFIPYLYCNNIKNKLKIKIDSNFKKVDIPIASIISNNNSSDRNNLLFSLMQHFPIVNFGKFMNNVNGLIPYEYNTNEFINILKQFLFIISFENSIDETYITEKIFHSLLSGSIPIYYGTNNITDYINKERILIIENTSQENIIKIINKIQYLINNKDKYEEIINKPIFTENSRYIKDIIYDSKNKLFKPKELKNITNIFCICNEEFEPQRYSRLVELFSNIQWIDNVTYNCKTYKTTITEEIYNKHVKTDTIFKLRNTPLRKSELSLTLNFLHIFYSIIKNYSSGIFLTLESDVMIYGDINNINNIVYTLNKYDNDWNCIHIGFDKPNILEEYDYFDKETNIGIKRKYNPRCTDSFIWTYNGIVKFIKYLENNDLDLPFDYIFWNFLKETKEFHFYWSNPTVFIQGSNSGMEESTIQNDVS